MRRLVRAAVWLIPLVSIACSERTDQLEVAGTIEIRQVSVAPLTQGRLIELRRDEGDTVVAGDTIAVLEQPGLEQRIAELAARRAALVARARDLEAGARPQEIAAAQAVLARARADSSRAAADARRMANLHADTVVSDADWDAARTGHEAAAARVSEARENLRLLQAGSREDQIAAAWHEAEAGSAALAAAREEQGELTLTAPADGIILLRLAERGEAIAMASPVVTLGLTREPWVRAFVGQRFIARVRLGSDVEIAVAGYPDTTFSGSVIEIKPEAEFTPRAALTERERADLVFAIKVGIDDAAGRLKPGMPVDLVIELAP